jgi:succinylglutamate desuccinylase
MITSRLIGRYDNDIKGPLVFCFGAMHGNEPAGVRAIELVLKMLDVEHIKNNDFLYKGRFVGLIGNLNAFNLQQRFIDKDMNRQFQLDNINRLKSSPPGDAEDREIKELIEFIENEIQSYNPDKVIFLDLHTTSSHGGIFTICRNDPSDIDIALALHAPVVLGIAEGLKGTTLHYFNTENMGTDTTCISFESGQHEEGKSINRAIAGIICLIREVGAVRSDDVENYHEAILQEYASGLPKLTKLVDHYGIQPDDTFEMQPGYENFQSITKGEFLAINNNEKIEAKYDGRILMPLYQKQGEDGFFIIQDISIE